MIVTELNQEIPSSGEKNSLIPSVPTTPDKQAPDEYCSLIGDTRRCNISPSALRAKILAHMRLKRSMSAEQIRIALAVPGQSQGGGSRIKLPPKWLIVALNQLVTEGVLEFSQSQRLYRLPVQQREVAA